MRKLVFTNLQTIGISILLLIALAFNANASPKEKSICPVAAGFTISESHPAVSASVAFTNTSSNATNYKWLVNAVQVSSSTNYTTSFNTTGVYTISLIAADNSCADTMTQMVYVGCLNDIKRADNWYFGTNAAISFASGSPVALSGSAMIASEGVSTISDQSGNLLFYSNGLTVWNRNNLTMPNGTGLLGSSISAQSSIIIPVPGNANQYYLFTVPNWTDNHSELAYSTIDMTLNGGLGDIIPASKNIILNNNVAEQVTAAYNANCKDIWVVTHEKNNAKYVIYSITAAGVSTVPIVSTVGNIYDGANRYGSLRMSHNGKKLCSTSGGVSSDGITTALSDFDASTGIVSNSIYLETTSTLPNAYTSEFSTDDKLLYIAAFNDNKLRQYDLTQTNIATSVFNVQTNGTQVNVLQMGPDAKIYAGINNGGLSTIQFPNVKGNGCGFTPNTVTLTGTCQIGLPNFFPSYFQQALTLTSADTICQNTSTLIHLISSQCNATYQWDVTTGNGSISVLSDTLVQFTANGASGNATVRCIRMTACANDTVTKNIFVKVCNICPLPVIVDNDTAICPSENVQLSATTGYDNYTWLPALGLNNTSTRTPIATPATDTKYIVTATTLAGCISKDSILIHLYTPAVTPQIFTACNSFTYKGTTYISNTALTEILQTSQGCDSTITTNIIINKCVCMVTVNNDTTICAAGNIQLSATPGFDSYIWQPATTLSNATIYNPIATPTADTKYIVTATAPNGCVAKDSIIVSLFAPAIGTQTFTGCNAYLYKGNNYTTNTTLNEIILSHNGCDSMLTTNIVIKPTTASTTNMEVCSNQLPYLWNGQNFNAGTHSVILTNAQGCDSVATINLSLLALPVADLGADQALCTGASLTVTPGNFLSYKWQDGSTENHYTVTKAGTYSVTISNTCGTAQDEIVITENNCALYFPNAFTPDNTGLLNKIFKALNAYGLQEYRLQIFNRWGQMIFETTDYNKGWDGTFLGEEQPQGVYIWVCKHSKSNGIIKGTVMLIR